VSAGTSTPVALGPSRHGPPSARPATGPLVDRLGRVHRSLRISVTDRCNFRCTYCMPDGVPDFRPRPEILSFEEIVRVAAVARDLGVTSVRITGGEPLVRHGLVGLVADLSGLGFADLALTTNGSTLSGAAAALAAAGLRRINISCDSLRPDRFRAIRRHGELGVVLDAMDVAESVGFPPVKVNVVLQRGVNDDEILGFAAFARRTGREVRFIEFMPLDARHGWDRRMVVPGADVVRQIGSCWPVEPVAPDPEHPAPASGYRFTDGRGGFGVISTVTEPFCGTCDRLRLTADGAIRNCLFSDDELSVRTLLRGGAGDEELAGLLRRSVWGKAPAHGHDGPSLRHPRRSMFMIGG
jgi:GTP 3',8-cyclase